MSQDMGRELSWDDEIEKDGGEFILLPEGDYPFTVTKFERARYAGGERMSACNQAKLELTVHSPEHGGDTIVFHNLYLHTKTEGLLSNFFCGIGQKEKGEKVKMDWNRVYGAKGRLKLEVHTYTKDGQERQINRAKTFYPYEKPQGFFEQRISQPQHQAPFPTGSQNGGFTPGKF